MREVYYHDWLSNPVMVKKHDGSWRMCVDFTDLNKACPRDCYPLPKIDWKVESLCGYPFKSFLDAYKGYHQIQLAAADEEKKLSTQDRGSTAIPKCLLASKILAPRILPGDEKKARKLRLKARQYELMEGIIYKRSFLTPWLRCMGPLQAEYIEAKAVATITGGQVKKFVWDNIVCRFGILGEIISDNGKQFADNPFKDWCYKLNSTQRFASVKHPQSNGLVERANRSLGDDIKARLGEGNKNWVEELLYVLWAHRTMIKSSHSDTPFSLTYGTEAVIPAEIGMPTYRTTAVDVVNNDEELRINLDLLEERRELAAMSEAMSKSKMMKYYNSRVRGVAFKPGDFVYRSNDASHAVAGGKLGPKWEGPYEVTDALGNEAYKSGSTDGTMLSRTWNVTNLKRCYL
uniref:Reverse transcriptase domain-containing protein n=1 Tax=Tanacetum cinerariifolium TaxID=118510 RepID=A0A6L2KL11_TANCI|nr:reverse transcriptase domain-containing protein [Tanacetum cinerariifolium]